MSDASSGGGLASLAGTAAGASMGFPGMDMSGAFGALESVSDSGPMTTTNGPVEMNFEAGGVTFGAKSTNYTLIVVAIAAMVLLFFYMKGR
ncbi:hypothetical protein L4174_005420 [Photobacterium sp. CCB-ST2H9]|uniref:hypothetical protein n=1 Tax=Photobacterium sp. CCB-ST2H9 TaxID=2912855 RepID=UPI0020C7287C|nr:hypothetical protein [Photobacterium sp. CCB-ST2H9]UTM57027.1 hypothetical protein L4174_014685 [Photobacterium sp. CCB-ST2H9]UTM58282.1 hypothetical protein L4174_005420 [Photobacterium sp. CCB-ST2H9]